MAKLTHADGRTFVEQTPVIIPDFSVKDLLAHCHKRSTLRSMSYVVWDFFLLAVIYKSTIFLDARITPEYINLPHPFLYTFATFALWAVYSFATGLVATGVWVLAHECGHQAFSDSKIINNTIGWILHSALGVPYHSWRITHARHHASTAHMTQDEVFVPKTRSERRLPEFDPAKEDLGGASISNDAMSELWEALGDTPIGAVFGPASYLLGGWVMYLVTNASGQRRYPAGSNHFNPNAVMFSPHHYGQIIVSDIGILIWFCAVIASIYHFGIFEVFRTYIVTYLWVNHWLVLITFLQHTDPTVPHYRAAEFTFPRGALATLDRQLLGDCGKIMGWIGACTTHGISETHVAHHVASRIPHYHAWEATDALRKRLAQSGIKLQGRPGGWAEMYRVFKECKFVEDEGDIVFYKNAQGLAVTRPVLPDNNASDSGIEMVDKET
ncbi:unnamed protein product [Somion occarium]|uniref:Fatty acid desaturase domain-containing protein n=1 Tax=Somion occarium TaxID=3059160 RepID=A0ABP1DYS8_9APHY